MKKFGIAGACVLLAACGGSLPAGGYGDIHYGMTAEELQSLGFACSPTECTKGSLSALPDGPKFGFARASAQLSDGRMQSLDLVSLNYNDDEMIEMYRSAYGSPETCRFSNALGANIEKAVWTAKDGSTATISKILDYGAAFNTSGLAGSYSAITYRDDEESTRFTSVSC